MSDGKQKVIIVEDDRELRRALQFALEENGYTVSLAPSGFRLISQLQVERPDAILLDVSMAWVDGFELCRAIKKNPRFSDIPVCFIADRSEPADLQKGIDCGAAGYLAKPISLPLLVEKIKQLTFA